MNLTPDQQAQIRAFYANVRMVEAVHAALLPAEPFADGVDTAKDDAEYGRAVKVWASARDLIEQRFNEMRKSISTNPQTDPVNGAR